MSYSAEQKTVRHLLTSQLYRIPRNQRKYVWDKDNWEDLFLDLNFATKNNLSHFIGSMVLLKDEETVEGLPLLVVIDGQQRLFTITIFLAALLFVMKKYNLQNDYYGTEKYLYATDDKNISHHVFESSYHLGLGKILTAIPNLKFGRNVSIDSFLKTHVADKIRDKNIMDAFSFYVGKIEEFILQRKDDPQSITVLKDAILNTEYVRIEATTEEDSYTIFEILNARGQTLADHELLKNYVMRYIEPKEKVDNVKTEWEDTEKLLGRGINKYLLHYLIHRYKVDENDKKDAYKAIKKYVKITDIESFYSDFIQKAQYYSKLQNPRLVDGDGNEICSDLEYSIFTFFRKKRQEQFRPVILSLMHQKELGELPIEEYEQALEFIKNFFVCYTIIGKAKSNTLTSIISSYAFKLENSFSSDLLREFFKSLKDRIPNKDWFEKAFSMIGYSHHFKFYNDDKEEKKARLVLEIYEESLGNKNMPKEYTIEHILLDSDGEQNSNIGNLLPLEEGLNKKCANLPLKDKIKIYKKSDFKSVRRFVDRYENKTDTFKVEKRMSHLATEFYKIINKA
jgi:hypothetical protein